MVTVKNDIVSDARIVLGGVAPFPLRSLRAEAALRGKRLRDAMGSVSKAAVDGAQPLSNNSFKVIAAKGITKESSVPSHRKQTLTFATTEAKVRRKSRFVRGECWSISSVHAVWARIVGAHWCADVL